jgi:ubiquinone/menaquinone biosynthesis C-methylase UbiE
MQKLKKFITPLHKKTQRNYIERMMNEKVKCMRIAKKYGKDYWDGDRKYGYGGYTYDGRWKIVAQKLIKTYKLTNKSSVLDVGCGKGHLLFEILKLLPGIKILGIDISKWGINHAPKQIRKFLKLIPAESKYPFSDNEFDLVISLNTLHNLKVFDLKKALSEIDRVGKNKYITMESFRNDLELFNLECWALTCQAFFSKDEWVWMFKEFGYSGDYEFIYFE